jgi:hypothetical protein
VPVVFFIAVSRDHFNVISHHTDSTLFGLLAFALFVCWMDNPRPPLLFLAGAGAGVTTWFMLPKGALLCLSFMLLLWIHHRRESGLRPLLTLLCGYALVVALVVALFWLAGGLPDLIYANLLWPLTNYSGVNVVPYGWGFRELCWDSVGGFRLAFSPATTMVVSAFLSVPFMFILGLPIILTILGLCYWRGSFDRTTMPYWLAGGAFWLSEMHRKDLTHLVFGSPLLVILTFYLYRRTRGKLAYWTLQFVAICAFALALQNPLVAMSARTAIYTRRGVVRNIWSGDRPVLQFLDEHTMPGEAVFVYPYAPLYYFLSATTNPTRYSILMYQIDTESQFRNAVRSLETNQVRYVVWDRSAPQWFHKAFPAYRIPPPNKLIMEPYLVAHYRVVGGTDTGFQFLERTDSPTMSAVPAARSEADKQP